MVIFRLVLDSSSSNFKNFWLWLDSSSVQFWNLARDRLLASNEPVCESSPFERKISNPNLKSGGQGSGTHWKGKSIFHSPDGRHSTIALVFHSGLVGSCQIILSPAGQVKKHKLASSPTWPSGDSVHPVGFLEMVKSEKSRTAKGYCSCQGAHVEPG